MKKWIKVLFSLTIFCISIIVAIDSLVIGNTKERIYDIAELKKIKKVDAILVLGAGLKNNKPSKMLEERLQQAIILYENGISNKIIVSGDHGRIDYDEVNVMKQYLIDNHIPEDVIFMDHAGFNTYDSMYRSKYIFNVERIVVVTQEYHLYRALYIANSLGIDAYGSNATKRIYSGQRYRNVREILARVKDFFLSIFKPKSSLLGDKIDLGTSGNVTNDFYINITPILSGGQHHIRNKEIYDEILLLTKKDRSNRVCGGTESYTMELNGSKVYSLEVFDNIIHIVDDDEEIILTEEESKIIFDIVR